MNPLALIALIAFIIAQAATQPTLYEVWSPSEVIKLVVAIVTGVLSILAVLKSRENAARLDRQETDQKMLALHIPAPAKPPGPSSNLLLLPLLLLPFFMGCANMSDGQKLYAARGTYVSTLRAVNTLMEQGVITNANDKEAIWQAKEEAHAALDAAEAKFLAGDKLGFAFVWSRLQSAMDRLIRIQLSAEKRAGKAETSWAPSKSSSSSWRTLARSRSSPTFSAA